jgi:hypothetical protein
LRIAPLPADAQGNEYVHPILAGGEPVRAAGGVVVEHQAGKLVKITLDQDSKAYCPSFESLREAVRALAKLDVPEGNIERQDHPPQCAPAP